MREEKEYWTKLYFYEKLKEKAEKLLKTLQGLPDKYITKKDYFTVKVIKNNIFSETNPLINAYNRERVNTEKLLNISLAIIYSTEKDIGLFCAEALSTIILECEKVIGTIKSKISPLSTEQELKLEPLKEELHSILPNLDIAYEKNMKEAINECEQGHFMASAMITSRVICYIIDQIKGKTIEDKNKFLKEKGIIDKDNRGEITTDFIQKADKNARNYFSHNINAFADCSDSIELLGACVKLLKIIQKYKK